MYKAKFTLSDDTQEFEGFTDGSLWNGWSNAFFTREQVIEFLPAQYDPIFLDAHVAGNHRDFPVLILNNGRETETIESTPITTDDGQILEGYCFEGFEFMEVGHEA